MRIKTPSVTEKEKLAERLRRARQGSGMTQQAVADKTKISRSAVVAYELGKVTPGALELARLAETLAATPNYLLSGSDHFFQKGDEFFSKDSRMRAAQIGWCLDVLDQDVVDHVSALILTLVKGTFPQKIQFDTFIGHIKNASSILEESIVAMDMATEKGRHKRRRRAKSKKTEQ